MSTSPGLLGFLGLLGLLTFPSFLNFYVPWVEVIPQGFGVTIAITWLSRATNALIVINVLLATITLFTPYTFNYEISLLMIVITGQDL